MRCPLTYPRTKITGGSLESDASRGSSEGPPHPRPPWGRQRRHGRIGHPFCRSVHPVLRFHISFSDMAVVRDDVLDFSNAAAIFADLEDLIVIAGYLTLYIELGFEVDFQEPGRSMNAYIL